MNLFFSLLPEHGGVEALVRDQHPSHPTPQLPGHGVLQEESGERPIEDDILEALVDGQVVRRGREWVLRAVRSHGVLAVRQVRAVNVYVFKFVYFCDNFFQ